MRYLHCEWQITLSVIIRGKNRSHCYVKETLIIAEETVVENSINCVDFNQVLKPTNVFQLNLCQFYVLFYSNPESLTLFELLALKISIIKRGRIGISLTCLTLPHCCACPKSEPGFPLPYAMVFLVLNGLRWEVVDCFVDIELLTITG